MGIIVPSGTDKQDDEAHADENEPTRCGSDGGRGIGAGHVCLCVRLAGHPLDGDRPHGCSCSALWGCRDCHESDSHEGCAACGAAPLPLALPGERPGGDA